MLPTLPATVPLPLVTVHVCVGELGWVRTVTREVLPLGTGVLKLKVPFPVTARLSPPLSCKVSPTPSRPTTLPPMEPLPPVKQLTWMPVTLALAVPLPPVTVQVCAGLVGWAETTAVSGCPPAIRVLN